MTVHTGNETDMRALEGALDDCVCHIFGYNRASGWGASRANCGVPRSEQPMHGPVLHIGARADMTYCPGCGRRYCEACRRGDG